MDYTNPVSTLQTFSTWSLFPFCSPFCIWTIRSLNASSISRLSLYFGYPHYYGGPHWDRVLLHLNLPALEHLSIWSDSLSARPISVFLGRHPKIVTFHICGPVPRCLHSMRGKALQKMVSLRGSSSWSLTGVEAALRAIGRRDQPVDLAVVLPQYCGFWLEGSLRKTKVEATLRCVSKLRISFNSPQVLPDIVAALPGWLARLPALECVRIDDAVKEDDTDAKDALINAVMRACPRLRSCELSTAGVHAVVNGMVEHGSAESWVEQYPNPKLAPWPP
ncbi:hypothetical protein BV22DRAFT_146775 [Leucogyrophana mollusca]|uniref:Uncharacterized protein n=1 Tax=Leucogyrophana mollusca TaxID=85980 RepID=A0ACB8BWF7_9AGAM|nr:hypothetical protein BV22DRAFT_146775 [Leucogyrophana mollusca]